MKSKFTQPMKSTFLKAALCGAVTLAAAAPWGAAEGAAIRRAPRGAGRRARIHEQPAPRPIVNPEPAAKPELPLSQAEAIKLKPNAAPRAAIVQPTISRHYFEIATARLRHELYSHRWSFVYAASLKHAPKSIRFLQDGTVETDLKGEKWYWLALDGRRISLRSLADANQPGITLEFNEAYTGFQYALPNQTIAVQGATIETVAEDPAMLTSDNGQPAAGAGQ